MQCGLQSQLAYIYIYIYIYMCATSVMLRNAIKSPVTFLITMSVRSVYAYYSSNAIRVCVASVSAEI